MSSRSINCEVAQHVVFARHRLLYLMLLVKTSKLTQDYGSTDTDSAGMQELFLVCPFLSLRLPIPVELGC